ASAATIVTSAGDSIKMPRNATMMVHMPSGIVMGPAATMRKLADTLDRVTDSIVATYRWVSPKSAEDLRALMEAETVMTADEALANGFATEVTDAEPVAALFDLSVAAQLEALPAAWRARVDALIAKPAALPEKADPGAVARACREAGFPDLTEDLLG